MEGIESSRKKLYSKYVKKHRKRLVLANKRQRVLNSKIYKSKTHYIVEHGNQCEICGWNKGRCIVQRIISIKDGGSNSEDNLIVLCPNCVAEKKFKDEKEKPLYWNKKCDICGISGKKEKLSRYGDGYACSNKKECDGRLNNIKPRLLGDIT